MTSLIVYGLSALLISFLCSIMEAVLLSVTPSYIIALEEKNHKVSRLFNHFKEDINRPLAAILSLNTISHTVGAAGVGAQATIVFGSSSLGITSGILTLLILVFSEIIPKTLGARHWRALAPPVAYGLTGLIWVMYPFVMLSRRITRFFSSADPREELSRDELSALAELGERAGLFAGRESLILRNLLRFHSLQVKDVMTPRPVVFAVDANETADDVLEKHGNIHFSRIPVFLKNIDSIIGYVLKSDLLIARAGGDGTSAVINMKRDILSVPFTLSLSNLFERLLDHRDHIALVVDEFGGTAGIVTMEDVVETMLGLEIVDEADAAVDMQAMARAQWKKRARGLGLVPEEDHEPYGAP